MEHVSVYGFLLIEKKHVHTTNHGDVAVLNHMMRFVIVIERTLDFFYNKNKNGNSFIPDETTIPKVRM